MVKSDLGIGFVPKSFARGEILQKTIFALSLDVPNPMHSVCLWRQKDQPLSIVVKELEHMIRAL